MNKKKVHIFCLVIQILILFTIAFWVKYVDFHKSLVVYILTILDCFFSVFIYFFKNSIITLNRIKALNFINFESIEQFLNSKETTHTELDVDSISKILNQIFYPLQMIEICAEYLSSKKSPDMQITAARLINDYLLSIKRVIGDKAYEKTNLKSIENEIPYELTSLTVEDSIIQNMNIAILGPSNSENLKLKVILQSHGFFCRIIESPEEVLFSIEDGLIQFLIVQPEAEHDSCFVTVKKIRQNYSLLDIPVLVLVNNYRTYLIRKCYDSEINDFIIRPFDVSELISRIRSLANYRNLYLENSKLADSEKEKRAFLYFVTHNVNTPLTILLNEVGRLNSLSENNPDPQLNEIVANVCDSVNEIDSIIQNVLNSYRISDGRMMINPKVVNIVEFINMENKFLANKATRKNQKFIFEFENSITRTFCDENSLKCIYNNLVDNAIKYTDIGGNVTAKVFSDSDYVWMQVMDNGQGIPKEKQYLLFSRFSNIGSTPTGKEKSLGLGLYIVSEICRLNGLDLEYSENKEGRGSVFTIRLPKIS